jgi:hypothetical protein
VLLTHILLGLLGWLRVCAAGSALGCMCFDVDCFPCTCSALRPGFEAEEGDSLTIRMLHGTDFQLIVILTHDGDEISFPHFVVLILFCFNQIDFFHLRASHMSHYKIEVEVPKEPNVCIQTKLYFQAVSQEKLIRRKTACP